VKGATISRVSDDEVRGWIEANPLRRRRRRAGLSQMMAASMIGTGVTSIQVWENGSQFPGDDSLARIAAFLELDEAALARAWRAWYRKRP